MTVVFLIVGAVTAAHHEMWRDELQAWVLARDSRSVRELYGHLKYEGHPGLWHLCLMTVSWLAGTPFAMQAFHLLLAATTVFLFARFAPFRRPTKILATFGYFFVYEYSIVCRNYALGVLLLTAIAIVFPQRQRRLPTLAALLFLLPHTSMHALIVATAIMAALFYDFVFDRAPAGATSPLSPMVVVLSFVVMGLGVASSIAGMVTPPDSGYLPEWITAFDIKRVRMVLSALSRAYFMVPPPDLNFWGNLWYERFEIAQTLEPPVAVALFVWVAAALALLKRPTFLIVYAVSTLGLLSFFYVKNPGYSRHWGFLFLTLVMVAWMSKGAVPRVFRSRAGNAVARFVRRSMVPLMAVVFAAQFVGGITAIIGENQLVFSNGRSAAALLERLGLRDALIVSNVDHLMSTLLGYLGAKNGYQLGSERFNCFTIWDQRQWRQIGDAEVLARTKDWARAVPNMVLMTGHAMPEVSPGLALTALGGFEGPSVTGENFFFYTPRLVP